MEDDRKTMLTRQWIMIRNDREEYDGMIIYIEQSIIKNNEKWGEENSREDKTLTRDGRL